MRENFRENPVPLYHDFQSRLPLLHSASHLDREEVQQLNERSLLRVPLSPNSRRLGRRENGDFCLSLVAFGLLVAVLVTVLLSALIAVGLLCWRQSPANQRSKLVPVG